MGKARSFGARGNHNPRQGRCFLTPSERRRLVRAKQRRRALTNQPEPEFMMVEPTEGSVVIKNNERVFPPHPQTAMIDVEEPSLIDGGAFSVVQSSDDDDKTEPLSEHDDEETEPLEENKGQEKNLDVIPVSRWIPGTFQDQIRSMISAVTRTGATDVPEMYPSNN